MSEGDKSNVDAIAKARSHPLRRQILMTMRETGKSLSPMGFARMIDMPVSNVSYHFSVLLGLGFIKLADRKARRGAIEHFYVPSAAYTEELADTVAMDRITEILESAAEAGELRSGPMVKQIAQILLATGRPVNELL